MEADRLEAAYRAQGYPAVLVALAIAALIYWLWVELERDGSVPDVAPVRRSGTYAKDPSDAGERRLAPW